MGYGGLGGQQSLSGASANAGSSTSTQNFQQPGFGGGFGGPGIGGGFGGQQQASQSTANAATQNIASNQQFGR